MDWKGKLAAGAVALAVPFVALWEGYSPRPYVDVVGVLTDCYGNTKNVSRTHIRSKAQCNALLNNELGRIANKLNNEGIYPNEHILAAMTSFTYNVGDYAYAKSTLRRRLVEGKYAQACTELNRWVYGGPAGDKRVIRGLQNRRAAEYELCMEGVDAIKN